MGESTDRLAGLAEAHMLANDGMVSEAARKAYERLRVLAPDRMEPRFWLAVAAEQDGRLEEAAKVYAQLLTEGSAAAPWRPTVGERWRAVRRKQNLPTEPVPDGVAESRPTSIAPALSREDVRTIQQLPEEERRRMIEGMVAGLDQRFGRERPRSRGLAAPDPRLHRARPPRGCTRGAGAGAGGAFGGDPGPGYANLARALAGALLMTRRHRRGTMIGVALAVLAAAVGLVLAALRDTIVFFHTPSDVAAKGITVGQRFRLGGLVADGSLKRGQGTDVEFAVTDTPSTVTVQLSRRACPISSARARVW